LWLSISAKTPTTNKKSNRPWKRCKRPLTADNGYFPGGNLQALEHSSIDAYIATDKGEKTHKIPVDGSDRKLFKAGFDYCEADNTFTCLEGQVLTMKRESSDGSRVYQGI